jgi:hypothetical protein
MPSFSSPLQRHSAQLMPCGKAALYVSLQHNHRFLADGKLQIQVRDENGHIVYHSYGRARKTSFLDHFDPARIAVPKYQHVFEISSWIFFLFVYTITIEVCFSVASTYRSAGIDTNHRLPSADLVLKTSSCIFWHLVTLQKILSGFVTFSVLTSSLPFF